MSGSGYSWGRGWGWGWRADAHGSYRFGVLDETACSEKSCRRHTDTSQPWRAYARGWRQSRGKWWCRDHVPHGHDSV